MKSLIVIFVLSSCATSFAQGLNVVEKKPISFATLKTFNGQGADHQQCAKNLYASLLKATLGDPTLDESRLQIDLENTPCNEDKKFSQVKIIIYDATNKNEAIGSAKSYLIFPEPGICKFATDVKGGRGIDIEKIINGSMQSIYMDESAFPKH